MIEKESIRIIIEGFIGVIILGFLFYRSIIGIIFLSPLIILYYQKKRKVIIAKRKLQLNIEFRDGINSLSAALSAGYSVEQGFTEALLDLKSMYPKGAMIINEFAYITKQIQMNIPVEKALRDFASRSGIEDIISFSEVFSTAKRTGGDLTKIIKTTTDTISNKIEVKREIVTLIAAKKFEANIMKIVPAGILCYLSLSSPEMLKPLYHNLFGILIMTFILGVYLCSYKLIDKIVDIEV
jgi:tight adherence protein B